MNNMQTKYIVRNCPLLPCHPVTGPNHTSMFQLHYSIAAITSVFFVSSHHIMPYYEEWFACYIEKVEKTTLEVSAGESAATLVILFMRAVVFIIAIPYSN